MANYNLIKEKRPWIRILAMVLALILTLSFFAGCASSDAKPDETTSPPEKTPFSGLTTNASAGDLYCLEFTGYSGAFYEDGTNESVENIAAILVENRSDEFLERATITYDVEGKTATFVLTGLPVGKKCWVLEQNRMPMTDSEKFKFLDCVTAFRKGTSLEPNIMDVDVKDDVLTVTNKTEDAIYSVCVYYKNTHDDGNFLGGITYLISIEEIAAGESRAKRAGHYNQSSEIVRCSHLTE